jgi:hypothetical protein
MKAMTPKCQRCRKRSVQVQLVCLVRELKARPNYTEANVTFRGRRFGIRTKKEGHEFLCTPCAQKSEAFETVQQRPAVPEFIW